MPKPSPFKGQRGVAALQGLAATAATAEQTAADATTPHWDNIVGKPSEFAPKAHDHDPDEVLAGTIPVEITGTRDDPESALANLLTALEGAGIITDSTTAT